MARIRNTKKLGQRVDRTYLRRLYPIPRWRRILTFLFVTAGLVWLGIYAIARNQTPYTAGSLTPSHAFLGKRCAVCHGSGVGIGRKVADQQCAACHDGPVHQASQTFSPACIACHVEHRGIMQLAGAKDAGCAACHSNLQTKSGKLTVAASVSSFKSHPEFAAVKSAQDTTGLRFNHQKHVGELSQKCADCHVPADVTQGMARPDPHSHVSSRALMSMPTYAATCMPCHALTIDDKIADAAPHDKPEVVHRFVVDQLTKYIAAHPADLGTEGAPRSAGAWVQFKVAADEKKLMEETCARCHTLREGAGSPGLAAASVTPTHVAPRWFTKASFDHAAHQGLTCLSCHPNGTTSKVSSDVLLPGIGVCRQCHASGSATAGANCSTCHVYHDWSKEKPVEGKYMIDQMTRLMPAGHPAAIAP
jgi:hypothetical protein